jgi:hypothetical protein
MGPVHFEPATELNSFGKSEGCHMGLFDFFQQAGDYASPDASALELAGESV